MRRFAVLLALVLVAAPAFGAPAPPPKQQRSKEPERPVIVRYRAIYAPDGGAVARVMVAPVVMVRPIKPRPEGQ
jgi:hypothetical protein